MNYIKIKDLSEPKKGMYGIGASAVKFNTEYPRYLRITDIKEDYTIPMVLPTCINPSKYKNWQNYIIRANDIVFARTGSIGRNYFCDKPASTTVFAGYLVKFSINSDIVVPKYVSYYCQSKSYWYQINSLVSGTVMPQINAAKYGESLVIPIISRTQQQHIVNTIGSVDDLIEHNRQKIANIENLIQGLFSDFESKEKTLFKDVFQTFNGYSFKSSSYVENSKYKLITIKNITDFGFNTDKTFFLNMEDADKKFELIPGDIILTMTGNIGRAGIVDEKNCFLNQRVLKINCISKSYLYSYVKKYKNNIIKLGKGTAQQNLSIVDLKNIIVKNSLKEIDNFKKYDTFFEIILNLKMQIRELNTIKKVLLDKYFTNQR